jgi:hypothetical protein
MKIKITILFLLIISVSCKISDFSEKLSDDYTYIHESEDNNYIIGKNKIYANVIDYKFNDDFIIACQIPNRNFYLSHFASELSANYSTYYNYLKDSTSEKFYRSRNDILTDSIIPKIFKSRKISFENTSEDIKKGEKIADSLMKNDPFHKKIFSLKKAYWIIKIKNNILIGPLSETEYKLKRKELNLNNKLTLTK